MKRNVINVNNIQTTPFKELKTKYTGRSILIIHISTKIESKLVCNLSKPVKFSNITFYENVNERKKSTIYYSFINLNPSIDIKQVLTIALNLRLIANDVIIYIDKTNIVNLINENLRECIEDYMNYSNVSIISYNDDKNISVPQNKTIIPFRKIVNIRYDHENSTVFNVNSTIRKINKYNVFKKPIKSLMSQWWLTEILNTPVCAFGRYKQLSGTCWFNTTINSLILSPRLSKMLTIEYEKLSINYKKLITDNSISYPNGWKTIETNLKTTNSNYKFKIFLFYLIYNSIINPKRFNQSELFLCDIPSKLVRNALAHSNIYPGATSLSVFIVFSTIFSNRIRLFNFSNNSNSNIHELFKNYSDNPPSKNKNIYIQSINIYNSMILIIFDQSLNSNPIKAIPKSINNKYTLECAGINPHPNHVITGIICNDSNDFIYDANDRESDLVITPWYDGNLGNYYTLHHPNEDHNNYPSFSFAIYIKI